MSNLKLKILYANAFYAPNIGGGAELTLRRLAEGMRERGHDVAAFVTGRETSEEFVGDIKVYRNKYDNVYWHFTRDLPGKLARGVWHWKDRFSALMAERFDNVLDQFKPDVVAFHNLSGVTTSLWDVAKKNGIPSVQVLHDLYLLCPNSSMFRRGSSCRGQCHSCAFYRRGFAERSNFVDALVGVSAYVADKVAEAGYFRQSAKFVINNAQEPKHPLPLGTGGALRFGFIGSLTPAKGLEWLIDQFPVESGTLSIAGSGSSAYVESLQKRALGKPIRFIGHTPSKDFFADIDVGIVPSLWNDTLPNVAIEASAWGRAVITSNRGGLPEIVQHGVNGLLCDPDNPDSLAAAITSLDQDRTLLRRLAGAGPASVTRFMNVGRFLDEYESLYRGLAGRTVKGDC